MSGTFLPDSRPEHILSGRHTACLIECLISPLTGYPPTRNSTFEKIMKKKLLTYLALILLAPLAGSCIYDHQDVCQPDLQVELTAIADDECATAGGEGDYYKYDLSALHEVQVAVFDRKTGKLVDVRSEKNAKALSNYKPIFPMLPAGDYVITVWAAETPNDYNTVTDAVPWKMDLQKVAANNGRLPQLFYGVTELSVPVNQDEQFTLMNATVNLRPYVQTFSVGFSGAKADEQLTLTYKDENPQVNFRQGNIERPTRYTSTTTARGADDALRVAVLRMGNSYEGVRLILASPETTYLDKSLAALLDDISKANGGIKWNLNCLADIPIHVDVEPQETYMRVTVRILDWQVIYRPVNLGEY